jgi:hypothetical protein
MTLQQKLNDTIITNIYIAESENRMCYDYNHLELAEECEKVADDFAIGFADWFFLNYTEEVFYDEDYTKKQLEIYKKEKAL